MSRQSKDFDQRVETDLYVRINASLVALAVGEPVVSIIHSCILLVGKANKHTRLWLGCKRNEASERQASRMTPAKMRSEAARQASLTPHYQQCVRALLATRVSIPAMPSLKLALRVTNLS